MAAPATATARARLTTVFQVSGCACAALIAAAFAATGAGVPAPTGPSPGCCESLLAATPYFILDSRTSAPAAFCPAGSGRCTRDGRQVAPTLTDSGPQGPPAPLLNNAMVRSSHRPRVPWSSAWD